MTGISEAAKRKASELFCAELPIGPGVESDSVEGCWKRALARVLQEHSDLAKDCLNAPPLGPERKALLRSLILPDEPCKHANFGSTLGGGLVCRDCGKALKIVEAGDE